MKNLILLLTALSLIIFSGCAAVEVSHDYDSDYNYSSLKTYKWYEVEAPNKVSELRVKRMVEAADAELKKKGFTQSLDNPDFLIALHGLTETKMNISDYGYGWGSWRSIGTRDIDVDTYQVGTVALDFVDPDTKELFWRGIAKGVLETNISPEDQKTKYAEAAAEMLTKFPPTK